MTSHLLSIRASVQYMINGENNNKAQKAKSVHVLIHIYRHIHISGVLSRGTDDFRSLCHISPNGG